MQQKSPPPLGRLLKEMQLVTEEQIQFSLLEQKATGERMGECLTRLGILTDTQLAKVLAQQAGMPFIDLEFFTPNPEALAMIPENMARQKQILPIRLESGRLHIAVADPYDNTRGEMVFRHTGMPPVIHIAASNILEKLIERFYYLLEHPVEQHILEVTETLRTNPGADIDIERLVNSLFTEAIASRATDIHIMPTGMSSRISFRIDGIMHLVHVLPVAIHSRLVTNIKVRSGMDISEQRRPQDGRMHFEFLGDEFDIRVSTVRSSAGESVVMRLLGSGGVVLTIKDLGLEDDQIRLLSRLFAKPYGILLVTGPTGSGKTTTLYAALRAQDTIRKTIVTVEDPVEITFNMIRQTQVNIQAGYTFASAIRTFLRQDPDVILVGEIRDEETAILATRAALTGHLVLSTLHANSAVSALARLKDLGISDYLMSTSVTGIMAQRLMRKLCPKCKEPYEPSDREKEEFGLPENGSYYRPSGCEECNGNGYKGRIAIAEILEISDTVSEMIASGTSVSEIEKIARQECGFYSIKEAGHRKIVQGVTGLDEFTRVLG